MGKRSVHLHEYRPDAGAYREAEPIGDRQPTQSARIESDPPLHNIRYAVTKYKSPYGSWIYRPTKLTRRFDRMLDTAGHFPLYY